jgi:tetratricopeptide (TPR) repeat protein
LFLVTTLLSTAALCAQGGAGSGETVDSLYAAARNAQAQGDLEGATQDYERILKINPHLGAAYNNLGMLYLQQSKLSNAAEVLQRGLTMNPRMASAAALLGIVYFQQGDFSHANTVLTTAIKLNPSDMHSRLILAKALMNLNQEEKAISELKLVVAGDARNQEAWSLLGKAYLAMSVQAMQKVNQIDPNTALSHELSGEVMQSSGNVDGALVEYKKAIEIAPTQPGTHEHLADAYWQSGNWKSAREEYLAEVGNDSANCGARWKGANSLLEDNGPPDQVLEEVNQALAECPNLTGARVDRARVLIKLGRPADALPDIESAEQVNPQDPMLHFMLTEVYRSQGRKEDAQREMQIYAKLQQNASDAVARRAAEVESLKKP